MTEDQNKQFHEPSANQPAGDVSADKAKEAKPVKEGTAPAGKAEEETSEEITPTPASEPENEPSENAAEEPTANVSNKEDDAKPAAEPSPEPVKTGATGEAEEKAETPQDEAGNKEKKAPAKEDEPAPSAKVVSSENKNPPKQDFDWTKFEGGMDDYSDNERDNLEKLYAETLSDVQEREVVKGKVVSITDKDVVLNIGFKSDGLVPLSEFKYKKNLQPGDEVEVLVETKEDKNGQIILSHRKALAESAWDTIVDAYETGKILEGYVKDRTKGGMIVEVMTLDSFMPGSQIDIKPIKDYDAFVGQTMDIKVVKLNPAFRNIVVSHKAIIESDMEQQKTEILSKLEKGQVLEGIVKNLTSFGVFVDLGGVDGLVHITDVSWGRINHPEEVLELGEKINVVVLDYDKEKKRISLG
ncbi:MAG: S1 RNA-binding domain-containing protein, partial [Bacteroidia bacterium]